jgi:hypothetical protein
MNRVRMLTAVMNELEQYFLQKSFFAMLINRRLNKKHSKIKLNSIVYNRVVGTNANGGVGL